jgi:hypothetical protein
MTVRYDIQQVTRYILTRTMNTDKGATVADLAEFKRRDDAERVMGTMRAAIHPVSEVAADGAGSLVERFGVVTANSACIKVGNDIAITLVGIEGLDTACILELLEHRLVSARESWRKHADGAAK